METGKSATDILKLAILLERKGKAFYTQVARQTQSKAVKQVFETMAEEENAHINFLSKQFKHYEKNQTFLENELQLEDENTETDEILSAQVKKEISAASFEAAAISAAIEFENKAIKVYSERAEKASDPNEKAMYQMLADWEKTHHRLLHRMNEDLKADIWNDNNFWPF
ncbi:MAG: ferritin family protein [Bacteroidales bacterium]|nr:ferritin family protein [Bacteroidales bacterium]